MSYKQILLLELMEQYGENYAKNILSTFSCPDSPDVEYYIRNKAIELARHNIAPTHLIFTKYKDKPVLIAYYTTTIKQICIPTKCITAGLRSKILKYGTYDKYKKGYILQVLLLAQIGKNFSNNYERLISGDELLQIACNKIKTSQSITGGNFVYLECEDNERLKSFYVGNGFTLYDRRVLDNDEKDKFTSGHLLQMIKYIN